MEKKLNIQKTKIMASSPITSWQIDEGENGNGGIFYFHGPQNHWTVIAATKIKRHLLFGRKTMKNLGSILKSRDCALNKNLYSQSDGFSSSHVQIWELNFKEGWAWKYWWFQTVVLEKTLESPLDCKEIKPVNPEGNQSWIFIWRTDDETKAPIFWPPDVKNWLIGKDTDAGKDWKQEKDDRGWDGWMASSTQRTQFEQMLRDNEGQGSLTRYSPLGHKESNMS